MKIKRILFAFCAILLITASVLLVESYERSEGKISYYADAYNGIYSADNGYLISLYKYHGKDSFLNNVKTVEEFLKKSEKEVFVAIPPRKMDALVNFLPEDFPRKPIKELFDLAEKRVEDCGGKYVDLYSALLGKSESAGDVYFKTDHHWTSFGAYLAYVEIISAMGGTPIKEDSFKKELFCDTYRGSDYTKQNNGEYDSIYLYFGESYHNLTVSTLSHPFEDDYQPLGEMYLSDRKNSYDPYTVYFGGNTPYVTVRSDAERDTLLLIRDSFASALAPFLAEHYDLVLIDPRFYPKKLSTLFDKESIDKILILENMGSYTENTIKFIY